MRTLKIIVIAVVLVVAIPLIIALFTAKDYVVEREVVINKSKQEVFDYIKHIRNQDHYSKWNMLDPDSKKDYTGTDGTVGFVYRWDSQVKQAGKGEQEITSIQEGERMDVSLHFIRPFEGRGTAYMATDAVAPQQTKVKWGMNGHMPYPMNFVLVIMNMDKALGGDIATSLGNLKVLLEK